MDNIPQNMIDETLRKASTKINSGDIATGTLNTFNIIENDKITPIATFKKETEEPLKRNMHCTVINLNNETFNIEGEIYPESFKPHRRTHLKRTFFKTLERFINIAALNIMGIGKNIYYYDSEGKVYIKDTDGNIYYVNSTRTGCIDLDGDYYDFVKRKEGHMMVYNPLIDGAEFDYFYITPDLIPHHKKSTEVLEPVTSNPFQEIKEDINSSSNVINLEDYNSTIHR